MEQFIYQWNVENYTYEKPAKESKQSFMDRTGHSNDQEIIESFKSYNLSWFMGTQEEYDLLDTQTETYYNHQGGAMPFKGINYIKDGKVINPYLTDEWYTTARWREVNTLNYFYYQLDGKACFITWIWLDYQIGNQNGTAPKFEDLVTDDNAIEITQAEYDTLKAQNDKDNELERTKLNLNGNNSFTSKLQVAEQSVFGLLDLHIASIDTEISIRISRALLGTLIPLQDWADGKSPTDADKAALANAKTYLTSNTADYTKSTDLKTFGMFLAKSQAERITIMYDLVINQGLDVKDAWTKALATQIDETPVAKLGEGFHEAYAKNVLGSDIFTKLIAIFDELDLGTHLPAPAKVKQPVFAPVAPTDTGNIV